MKLLRELAHDDFGSIDSMGYLLMVTIIAIGGITGLATLRDGIIQEGGDIGLALRNLDQTYSVWVPDGSGNPAVLGQVTYNPDGSVQSTTPAVNMTNLKYDDTVAPVAAATAGQAPNGIDFSVAPGGEGTPAATNGSSDPFNPPAGGSGESSPSPTPISSSQYPTSDPGNGSFFPPPTGSGG